MIDPRDLFVEGLLERLPFEKFVDQFAGKLNVPAKVLSRVAAQEETVEHGRFSLRRQGIDILGKSSRFTEVMFDHREPSKTVIVNGVWELVNSPGILRKKGRKTIEFGP